MNTEEALKTIQRQAPCPHDSTDTSAGDGKTWAKCHDCGAMFPQDGLMRARDSAKQFDDAIEHLQGLTAAERSRIRALIADDATAATYQSMGQYRTALLRALAS